MISVLQGQHEMGTGTGLGMDERDKENSELGTAWTTAAGTITMAVM